MESLADLDRLLAELDPDEPFPLDGVRRSRAKDARVQEVRLPDGYLRAPAEDPSWDAALAGG
jgi:hypothetical protein